MDRPAAAAAAGSSTAASTAVPEGVFALRAESACLTALVAAVLGRRLSAQDCCNGPQAFR